MAQLTFQLQRPSPKTLNYLEILFNDCGFTLNSRIIWLRTHFNKSSIKYLDDLTQQEASAAIEKLKEIRNRRNAS